MLSVLEQTLFVFIYFLYLFILFIAFIHAKIDGYDVTDILCVIYIFKLLSMKEVGKAYRCFLLVILMTSHYAG